MPHTWIVSHRRALALPHLNCPPSKPHFLMAKSKTKTKTATCHLESGHANSNTLFYSFTDSDITFAKNSPWSALNTLWELSKYQSHSMKAALFKEKKCLKLPSYSHCHNFQHKLSKIISKQNVDECEATRGKVHLQAKTHC